jgi:phosphoglycerate kinase
MKLKEIATIKEIKNIKNKNILMRVDYNVPYNKEGEISDKSRIESTIPTINYLQEKEVNNIILISHLGRPDGKVNMKYSLKQVSIKLSEILNQ